MLNKALILILMISFNLPAFAAKKTETGETAAKKPASEYTICQIQAGDIGQLKYRGTDYEEAFSKVADACFQKRNDMYISSRKEQPDQDRQIQFVESCVNNINCI